VTLLDKTIVRLLPVVPKPMVQVFSARYIAGPTLEDGLDTVGQLNREGKLATIDVLGEEITREHDARSITHAYCDVFAGIERQDLDSNASVKPTALGLDLSFDFCRENLESILREAAKRENFVRIDMEDSTTTTDTLRLYRDLRDRGHTNVGIVLPNVRLCKGIYVEPHSIAFTDYDAVRANYVRALDALQETGSYVAVATHDEWLIGRALERVARPENRNRYEFQMLLGVREQRATELVREGHRVRIYVPYGEQWYEYSLRRLQENPAMAGAIARATVGRMLGRA
jgi:proline dehydrogenase